MLEIFLWILAFLAAAFLLYVLVLLKPRKVPKDASPLLFTHYAHRGLHNEETPENSLLAFRRAAEHGYGIELDLQLSANGVVMVFHDYTLDRMTEYGGKLSDYTAAELQTIRLKTRGGELTEETIPTFASVLEAVDGSVPLLVELKGESLDASLCPAADALLKGYKGPYCVESFNPMLLRWYKKHQPKIMRGQLYTDVFRENGRSVRNLLLSLMALNVLSRPHFIACNRIFQKKLPVVLTERFFRAPLFTWTVRSEAERVNGYMIFENIRP